MATVGLILMGLVVASGWVLLDPRFRVEFLQGVYGKTDAEARKVQLRPANLAGLWAGRIAVTWLYLGLVASVVLGLGGDLLLPLFLSTLAVQIATWVFFYVWFKSKA